MTSVLTDALTHGITLTASGAYTAPFEITQTGTVAGAVYSNLAGPALPFLENDGFAQSVVFTGGGTVQNAGAISNPGLGYAILMRNGPGTVTNAESGDIYGANYGVAILGGTGLISNAGSIGGLAGAGVEIATGTITNLAGANIYAHEVGIKILGGGGLIQNAGSIAGGQYGVFMQGGAATNTGTISGQLGALFDFAPDATITNAGALLQENSPFGTGVKLAGGTLINTGFIYGATGVYFSDAGTIFNAGTIAAGFRSAIDLAGSGENRVIAAPGATFLGGVSANASASNVLELTAGQSTLAGIGEKFSGFQTLAFDQGAAWLVTGQAYGFAGDTITGFTTTDTLDIAGLSPTATVLTLGPCYVLSLASTLALTFSATNAGESFALDSDGHGGVLITEFTGTVSTTTTTYGSPVTMGGQTTITGPVNTVGLVGTYTVQTAGGYTTTTIAAGVLDNGGSTTTVTNTSTIQSNTGSPYDAGIVLTGASTLINAGTIIAASGIAVLGAMPGAYIESSQNIYATLGTGIYLQQYGSALNLGSITAATTGIAIAHGGYAYNSGVITARTGISAAGLNSYVYNAGQITATSDGIDLPAGGLAINAGAIRAGANGMYATGGGGAGGTAYNYGAITAATGILLSGAGSYAYNTGKIFSTENGIDLTGRGAASNTGAIQAGADGIQLAAGGVAYNYGVISAATGISVAGGGTIFEYGTLSGTNFAASFATGAPNLFVMNSSSDITGAVSGGGGVLELVTSQNTGTISLGQFEDFGTIEVDAKAKWDVAGAFATTATLDNNGALKLTKTAQASFDGAVMGDGAISLGASPATFAGAVARTQKIDFSGAHETLNLADPTAFAASIGGFTATDTIGVTGLALSSVTGTAFAGNVLTIASSGGDIDLTFATGSKFGGDVFLLTQQGAGFAITLAKPGKMALLKPAAPAAAAIPDFTIPVPAAPTPTYLTPSAAPGIISTFLTPSSAAPVLITLQS